VNRILIEEAKSRAPKDLQLWVADLKTMTILSPRFLVGGLLFFLMVFAGRAQGQAGPPFRTDDPETPGNKHWEINFGWVGDRNPAAGAYQVPDFDINYGLGDRIQLKYELPIAIEESRVLQPAVGSQPVPQGTVLGESPGREMALLPASSGRSLDRPHAVTG